MNPGSRVRDQKMVAKCTKPGFLCLGGHPWVVISGFLIRGPDSGSGHFKGRWMGISGQGAKGPFLRGAKMAICAAKGPWMGLPARGGEGLKSADFRDFRAKC